jgi:hypothetical protein
MAGYRITAWRDIPSLVEAFDGPQVVRHPLSPRFQELIDAVAMREGLTGTDAYLEGWEIGPPLSRAGTPAEVAEALRGELEVRFEEIRAKALGGQSQG